MIKKIYNFLWQRWFRLRRPLRFLLVGGFNNLSAYGLFTLLILLLGKEKYQMALILDYVLSSFVSFTTQKIFVFADKITNVKKMARQYMGAAVTWVIAYGINVVVLYLLVDVLFINVYLSQFLALTLIAFSNYYGLKTFAFKHTKI
ncbi:MAG: GtrA family protein [Alphaproteobacteria bacterium]